MQDLAMNPPPEKLVASQAQEQHITLPAFPTLQGLPVELLMLVSDFLRSDDILSLSLCNHRFFAILESQRAHLKQRERCENFSFLIRLKKSLPNHFACYRCFVLHKHNGSESRITLRPTWQWSSVSDGHACGKYGYICDVAYPTPSYPGIRWWSPTQLLTCRRVAYVRSVVRWVSPE